MVWHLAAKYPHRIIPGIESRAGDKYAMDVDVDVG